MTNREQLEVAQGRIIQLLEEKVELIKELGQIPSWEKTCKPRKNTKCKIIPLVRNNGEPNER
jgi:hypothetical protein